MKRIMIKGGDEQDALTGWRHYLHWKPGERKRIKKKYNKRVRYKIKQHLKTFKIT